MDVVGQIVKYNAQTNGRDKLCRFVSRVPRDSARTPQNTCLVCVALTCATPSLKPKMGNCTATLPNVVVRARVCVCVCVCVCV